MTEHLAAQNEAVLDIVRVVDQRLIAAEFRMQSLSKDIAALEERSRLRFDALYSYEGEDPDQSKRRFFASIPPAAGGKRLLQLANAKLMSKLDAVCDELGIGYWFAYGTLVATLSRSGFIPWDDDIDICMMRDDAERLCQILNDDKHYQITLVYDWFSPCRQLRFSSRDPHIPCFVDISLYDWARDSSSETDDFLRKMRLDIMSSVHDSEGMFPYWKERGWLLAPGSGEVIQTSPVDFASEDPIRSKEESISIERFFASYNERARESGILCSRENAGAVAYALDNTYDAPWRRIVWPLKMIFPLKRHPFEGYSFSIPSNAEAVADECYPGWPYLPSDILEHNHIGDKTLSNSQITEALSLYIDE